MVNQYFQRSYVKVANRLFFGGLLFIGLIAPFSFLKHKNITNLPVLVDRVNEVNSTYITIKPSKIVDTSPKQEIKLAERNIKSIKVKKIINEKPLHNVVLPNFSSITDVKEKKRRFFTFIKPVVKKCHQQLLATRAKLLLIRDQYIVGVELSDNDTNFINDLAKKYKVRRKYSLESQLNQLASKVDIVPMPLTLVQAANESAWGTSRFSRIGLNFFGIWCFNKGCGMVPSERNTDANHEVQAFESVEDAVQKYMYNINTNRAYRHFRELRKQLRDENLPLSSEVLATGLIHYSEKGIEYVNELIDMIRHNQKYFSLSIY